WRAQADAHTYDKSPANRPRNLRAYTSRGRVAQAPDPAIVRLIGQVDPNALRATVERLSSIEDRSVRSAGIQDATNFLLAQFKAYGYAPERQCFRKEAGGDICNVVAIKAASPP